MGVVNDLEPGTTGWSGQLNLQAVEFVGLGGVQVGDGRLGTVGGRAAVSGEVGVWAADQVGRKLRRVEASLGNRIVTQVLLVGLAGDGRNFQDEDRCVVRRVEPGDVLEPVILAGAIGVARDAGLAGGVRPAAAEILLAPPIGNAVADAVMGDDAVNAAEGVVVVADV